MLFSVLRKKMYDELYPFKFKGSAPSDSNEKGKNKCSFFGCSQKM